MSGAEENGVGGGGDDLADLQINMNRITDESLDSTRRMIQLAEESKEAGISTLVNLDEQGEQLDRIEEGMDKIHEDMGTAEKALEGLEACCGLCVLPWQKQGNKADDEAWKSDGGQVQSSQPQRIMGDGVMMSGNFVTKVTNDAREDEMENNVAEVSNMIGNLRNMAIDVGSEIDNQNRQIDRITNKGSSNEGRVRTANERAKELL